MGDGEGGVIGWPNKDPVVGALNTLAAFPPTAADEGNREGLRFGPAGVPRVKGGGLGIVGVEYALKRGGVFGRRAGCLTSAAGSLDAGVREMRAAAASASAA